jgi:hypothetical protein
MTNDIAQLKSDVTMLRREVERLQAAQKYGRLQRAVLVVTVGLLSSVGAARLTTAVSAAPTRVAAPFAVTNAKGEDMFIVYEKATGPSVEVRAGGTTLLQMGMGDRPTPAFRVTNASGSKGAALGVTESGYGALHVFNGNDPDPVAFVIGGGGYGPIIGVSARKDIAHASLRLGKNGGVVQLADNAGMVTAEGGVLPSGDGVFRVRGKVFQYISGSGMRLPGW